MVDMMTEQMPRPGSLWPRLWLSRIRLRTRKFVLEAKAWPRGLCLWNVRVGMIGCRPVEMWWWQGWDVRVEGGRLGMNVWRMIWKRLVCTLNGQCSGICGGASFREERLTLAERGKMDVLKNKWWWWWWWGVSYLTNPLLWDGDL